MFISILILLVCVFLGLFVLMQAPKGGGLASGFSGAQQIGGVQRTTDFLEKGTWTMAGVLMLLCLIGTTQTTTAAATDELDAPIEMGAPPAQDQPVDVDQVTAPADSVKAGV
ncbi:MAG: preprotein translocase subunit SecG [Flavobacteriales bacterium]